VKVIYRVVVVALLAAGVLLGLTLIGCNGKNPSSPGKTATVVVHIVPGSSKSGSLAYSPDTVSVAVGQTVQWINDDSMGHTATELPSGFDTGTIGGGSSKTITVTGATGLRPYHCSVVDHDMTGALNVTP
jgi:plastocyanin